MIWIIAALYTLSAALPLLGLVRLLGLATKEAKPILDAPKSQTPGQVTHGEVQVGMPWVIASMRDRPKAIVLDLVFIGSGLVLGAAASIWSLFLS